MPFFQNGRLPPVLYLQMDNCYRECKNRYIMAFCAFLVEKKIFKKVGRVILVQKLMEIHIPRSNIIQIKLKKCEIAYYSVLN